VAEQAVCGWRCIRRSADADMRQQPRLVYQPYMYQRVIDAVPSASNGLEMCVGTLAEMTEGDIYDAVDQYTRQGKVAYIHLRNVRGKVPHYRETFIDEGDVDMTRILTILDRNGFDGVVIPDHSPQMTCSAPWHAAWRTRWDTWLGCWRCSGKSVPTSSDPCIKRLSISITQPGLLF